MNKEVDKNRFVSAWWDIPSNSEKTMYEAMIQIYANDELGLLATISTALAEMRASILSINSQEMLGRSDDSEFVNFMQKHRSRQFDRFAPEG